MLQTAENVSFDRDRISVVLRMLLRRASGDNNMAATGQLASSFWDVVDLVVITYPDQIQQYDCKEYLRCTQSYVQLGSDSLSVRKCQTPMSASIPLTLLTSWLFTLYEHSRRNIGRTCNNVLPRSSGIFCHEVIYFCYARSRCAAGVTSYLYYGMFGI